MVNLDNKNWVQQQKRDVKMYETRMETPPPPTGSAGPMRYEMVCCVLCLLPWINKK